MPKPPPIKTCKTCGFYVTAGLRAGQCRRFPPTTLRVHRDPVTQTDQWASDYARTTDEGWCGEWTAK